MPCQKPSDEFKAAVKVLDQSEDLKALQNAFTTVRKISLFHSGLLDSVALILESIVGRVKKYDFPSTNNSTHNL